MSNRREEIEEIIIQGLSHQECRNILEIMSLAEDGASYSAILGELGLNTGRMCWMKAVASLHDQVLQANAYITWLCHFWRKRLNEEYFK